MRPRRSRPRAWALRRPWVEAPAVMSTRMASSTSSSLPAMARRMRASSDWCEQEAPPTLRKESCLAWARTWASASIRRVASVSIFRLVRPTRSMQSVPSTLFHSASPTRCRWTQNGKIMQTQPHTVACMTVQTMRGKQQFPQLTSTISMTTERSSTRRAVRSRPKPSSRVSRLSCSRDMMASPVAQPRKPGSAAVRARASALARVVVEAGSVSVLSQAVAR
mmetsp:Transcript_28219/g.86670  ORF Transcript_28219/g.86670 Transcript_28219/m.86670 type:complete len:221 (+) Transcript_28219:445-1107(+)